MFLAFKHVFYANICISLHEIESRNNYKWIYLISMASFGIAWQGALVINLVFFNLVVTHHIFH